MIKIMLDRVTTRVGLEFPIKLKDVLHVQVLSEDYIQIYYLKKVDVQRNKIEKEE